MIIFYSHWIFLVDVWLKNREVSGDFFPVWTGFLKFSFLRFNSVEALIRLIVVVQFSFVRRFVFHVFGDIQLKK